jgi:hypothetical protein
MGKLKNTKLKNKDALEFVLVNRGMDDPNYQNPEAPSRILLHVPKEEDEINEKHEKMLNQIPEMNRGVYSEKTIQNDLRELGIETLHGDMDYETLKNTVDKLNKEKFVNKVNQELMGHEEEVDTHTGASVKKNEKNTDKKQPTSTEDELDEKKIDELLKKAKISAEITEYNKFGLRKDIDPEVLKYVTDKEFVEGVDIFIPAPIGTPIEGNRYDIDIPVEQMNEDYKEVFDAMKSDDEAFEGELEDDIVLLANEGVLPIEIGKGEKVFHEDKDEMILTETQDRTKNPTYKYITKEEKEFLDKQFNKTMKEYENKEENKKTGNYIPKEIMEEAMNELIGDRGNSKKNNFKGLTKKFEDEEEFEDYEFDEDGDHEQFAQEYEEYSEEEEIVDTTKKPKNNQTDSDENKSENDDKVEYFENNFKIEYEGGEKKQNKKGKKPPRKPLSKRNDTEIFTVDDLNKLVHDERFVESTIILHEEKENNPQEENMDGIPVYYPKKRLDITTVHGKVGVLPKTVGEASVKLPKGSFKPKDDQEESKIHNSQGKGIVLNSNKPILPSTLGEETKEEKKLRKKLVKEEKSEKRKQKKELKTAFQVRIVIEINFLFLNLFLSIF